MAAVLIAKPVVRVVAAILTVYLTSKEALAAIELVAVVQVITS